MDVTDNSEIGNSEDGCFFVLVDGDDVFRPLHPDHVLGGSRDAGGDVDLGLHRLARLADLVGVGHPSGVDDRSRRTGCPVQGFGEVFDHRVLAGLTETTTAGDHDGGFVELWSRALLHVALGDRG